VVRQVSVELEAMLEHREIFLQVLVQRLVPVELVVQEVQYM
jgi:hypothetical protein